MNAVVSGFELEIVEVDQGSGTVRSQFDREQTPASMAVIATLADIMDVDPVELDPLHASVDPDALDAIVGVRHGTEAGIHITFRHEGHAITVSSDGGVTISMGTNHQRSTPGRDAGR